MGSIWETSLPSPAHFEWQEHNFLWQPTVRKWKKGERASERKATSTRDDKKISQCNSRKGRKAQHIPARIWNFCYLNLDLMTDAALLHIYEDGANKRTQVFQLFKGLFCIVSVTILTCSCNICVIFLGVLYYQYHLLFIISTVTKQKNIPYIIYKYVSGRTHCFHWESHTHTHRLDGTMKLDISEGPPGKMQLNQFI